MIRTATAGPDTAESSCGFVAGSLMFRMFALILHLTGALLTLTGTLVPLSKAGLVLITA